MARRADVTGDYGGYIDALEARRRPFIAHGATSATAAGPSEDLAGRGRNR